jgi:peptidyl-prolyl cis-trans isomerase D
MLQQLRHHAAGYVAKILFAILVASFAIWGIGDVVRTIANPDRPAVVAGSQEINTNEIGKAFQNQVQQLRQRFGQRFTSEQAAQLGLLDQTVERLVADSLFDQEAQRLGIEVGPELIRQQMRREPAFKDSTGVFTPGAFAMALRNAGLTEQEYVRMVRQGVDRQVVSGAVGAGALPPKALVVALERFRSERRTADTVSVPHQSMNEIPVPSEDDLVAYHKTNAPRFTAPEYRRAQLLRLAVDELAATLPVEEATIKEEYDRAAQEYQTPERRDLLQALVTEEADAKKLAEAAKTGDFAAAAMEIAKLDAETLKLNGIAKADLPAELGDPIFATPEGGVTEPIKSTLGWHVFKIEKIVPASTRSLDEVRDELKAQIAKEQAADQIARLSVKLEDEILGGGSFAEAAQKLNLKIVAVGPVDRTGLGPDGKPADLPPTDRAQLLKTMFETGSGSPSALVETDKGDFFVLRTEEVVPSALKPLDQVKQQVMDAMLAEKRAAAAKAKAAEIFDKAKAEKNDLATVAAASGFAVVTTPPVTRGGRTENVAPQVTAAIFSTKPGELARASTPEAEVVIRVKEILPTDAAEAEKQTTELGQKLRDQVAEDLATSYAQGLRQRYPVRIDKTQIEKMY